MNRREKCRCISLVLVTLMAIAGVVALIYGSVQIFRVSKEGLTADGGNVDEILNFFVKCSDIQAPTGAWSNDVITHALHFQCMAKQLPARAVSGFAGAFMILAILCIPAAFKKERMFGFTMWSTLSIATIVMSVALVSVYALPAAASMNPHCDKYDVATIQELQNMGVVCLNGVNIPNKTTALKWFCKLHTFYCGAAISVASLLLLFMIKHCCCCNPSSCCSSASASAASGCGSGANGEHPCVFRRAVHRLRARFCRRSDPALISSNEDMPVSAPSYYQLNNSNAAAEGEASEDAGVSPSNNYYGVN